jgi:hypothetical protein
MGNRCSVKVGLFQDYTAHIHLLLRAQLNPLGPILRHVRTDTFGASTYVSVDVGVLVLVFAWVLSHSVTSSRIAVQLEALRAAMCSRRFPHHSIRSNCNQGVSVCAILTCCLGPASGWLRLESLYLSLHAFRRQASHKQLINFDACKM